MALLYDKVRDRGPLVNQAAPAFDQMMWVVQQGRHDATPYDIESVAQLFRLKESFLWRIEDFTNVLPWEDKTFYECSAPQAALGLGQRRSGVLVVRSRTESDSWALTGIPEDVLWNAAWIVFAVLLLENSFGHLKTWQILFWLTTENGEMVTYEEAIHAYASPSGAAPLTGEKRLLRETLFNCELLYPVFYALSLVHDKSATVVSHDPLPMGRAQRRRVDAGRELAPIAYKSIEVLPEKRAALARQLATVESA